MKKQKRALSSADLFKNIKIEMPKSDAEIKAEMYKAIQAKDYKDSKDDKQRKHS